MCAAILPSQFSHYYCHPVYYTCDTAHTVIRAHSHFIDFGVYSPAIAYQSDADMPIDARVHFICSTRRAPARDEKKNENNYVYGAEVAAEQEEEEDIYVANGDEHRSE